MKMNALATSLVLASAVPFVMPDTGTSYSAFPTAVEKFLARPHVQHAYRASRRLEAAGSGHRGWLDAQTDFTPAGGFQYRITAEGGSNVIRGRVLRSLLEEERELIARGTTDAIALSSDNYRFAWDGLDPDGLARVALEPRRNERPLIHGHMFIRPEDGELVRVEGRLARNPSFWVTRVDVVRTYQRLNGALVPVLLESTAQLRLFGHATLRMTYRYSEIDERPVAHIPEAGSAAPQVTIGVAQR